MSFASTLRPTKSKTTAERVLAKGLLERRLGTTRLIDELLALDISLSRALELAQLAAALLIQTKNDGLHLHVLEQSLKLLRLAAAAGALRNLSACQSLAYILAGAASLLPCPALALKNIIGRRSLLLYCALVRFVRKAQLQVSAHERLLLPAWQFLLLARIAAKTNRTADHRLAFTQDIMMALASSAARSPEPVRVLKARSPDKGMLFLVLADLAHFLLKENNAQKLSCKPSRRMLRECERRICSALFACGAAHSVVELADPLGGMFGTHANARRKALLLEHSFAEGLIDLLVSTASACQTTLPVFVFEQLLFSCLSKETGLALQQNTTEGEIAVCEHELKTQALPVPLLTEFRQAAQEIEKSIAANASRKDFHVFRAAFSYVEEQIEAPFEAENHFFIFIERSRLPDAALWAPVLGSCGVLVCESKGAPERKWRSERADFFKMEVADGFVFVLDRTPLLELQPLALASRLRSRKAAPAAALNLLAWTASELLLFSELKKEIAELRALLESEQQKGDVS